MKSKTIVHLSNLLILALSALLGYNLAPQENRALVLVSLFGFIGLIAIIFVLAVPLFVKIKSNQFTVGLLANRRWLGIYSFIFAAIHLVLVAHYFLNWDLKAIFANPFTVIGSISLFVLLILTITSNNYSLKKLGKNWKRLQFLVYPALILAMIHAGAIGQIFAQILYLKILVVVLVVAIFGIKLYNFYKKKN